MMDKKKKMMRKKSVVFNDYNEYIFILNKYEVFKLNYFLIMSIYVIL